MTASPDRWTYVSQGTPKPHVHPLRLPSGPCLTRVEPDDHPWHRGLWFAIKFVDGDNFWEEIGPHGTLRHRDERRVEWVAPDGETVVVDEERTLQHVELDADAYGVDLTLVLVPRHDVVLDRTPFTTWGGYGGLTLRGRPDWTGTRLLLDDAAEHDRVLGARSRWCDLSGDVEGTSGGVAVLDAPSNPNHPVPWYASTRAATYGDEGWSNFLCAAFLWDGPHRAAGGEPLAFAYRVVVHDGTWEADRVEDCYRRWIDG